MEWVTSSLAPAEPVEGAGVFTPFARVIVRAADRAGWGSGFLVHPRVVVTAAHVVTFPRPEGGLWVAERAGVDVGIGTLYAAQLALPREFLDDGGGVGTPSDVAALLLPQAVCDYGQQLALVDADPAQTYPATIPGYASQTGPLRSQPVDAQLADGLLRYVAPNLPGFSGGAITTQSPEGLVVSLGSHSAFLPGELARGAPTPPRLVRSAMEALGFGFST